MKIEIELPDHCGCTCCSATGWVPDGQGGWRCRGNCGCSMNVERAERADRWPSGTVAHFPIADNLRDRIHTA